MSLKNKLLLVCICLGFHVSVWSCSDYPELNEYRNTNFDADFLNYKVLSKFIYDKNLYNGSLEKESYKFEQNIDQWYQYCNSKSVYKQDIYNVLYTNLDVDALKVNSFYQFIQTKTEAKKYLEYLLHKTDFKVEEKVYNKTIFKGNWGAFEDVNFTTSKYSNYNQEQFTDVELQLPKVLKHVRDCKDVFIQKRYAYQAIVDAFYGGDGKQVSQLFEVYFNVKNKTWIDNSAQHYYALAGEHDKKKELLLDAVIFGHDKMTRNITILNDEKSFNEKFALGLDSMSRSYYYFVKTLRNAGPALEDLKKIYALYPENKYFDFLINRELNKIEEYLSVEMLLNTNEIDHSVRKNLQNDKKYSKEFLDFVSSLPSNQNNSLFRDITCVYLKYMLGEKQISFNPDKYRKIENQYVQAKILDLFLNFDKAIKDNSYQFRILDVLSKSDQINRAKNMYWWDEETEEPNYMKDQLARSFSKLLFKYPAKRGEAFLLGAYSSIIQESNQYYNDFYSGVFNNASVSDIDQILFIINKKEPNKYYALMSRNLYHYSTDYVKDTYDKKDEFNVLKLLDLKAMKYIQQDKLAEALKIYESYPNEYWDTYFQDNPFLLDIGNTHNHGAKDEKTFTKKEFIQQLIQYKQALKKTPNDPLLNYYVANAYYSLTIKGKFWYMAAIGYGYDSQGNYFGDNHLISNFLYFKKALPYYLNVIKYSKDSKLRVLALMTVYRSSPEFVKGISASDKTLLDEVNGNCDLYGQYVNHFQNQYKPTIVIKQSSKVLKGFVNFDRI